MGAAGDRVDAATDDERSGGRVSGKPGARTSSAFRALPASKRIADVLCLPSGIAIIAASAGLAYVRALQDAAGVWRRNADGRRRRRQREQWPAHAPDAQLLAARAEISRLGEELRLRRRAMAAAERSLAESRQQHAVSEQHNALLKDALDRANALVKQREQELRCGRVDNEAVVAEWQARALRAEESGAAVEERARALVAEHCALAHDYEARLQLAADELAALQRRASDERSSVVAAAAEAAEVHDAVQLAALLHELEQARAQYRARIAEQQQQLEALDAELRRQRAHEAQRRRDEMRQWRAMIGAFVRIDALNRRELQRAAKAFGLNAAARSAVLRAELKRVVGAGDERAA